jgi:outer membrane protein OmpA-like peptidoglycan-associated protein
MKKLYTLLCFMVFTGSCFAQLRLGIIGGPHSASVTETNSLPGWETGVKPFYSNRSGFNIGFIAEIPLNKSGKLFLQPGIFYMSKGRKYQRSFDTTVVNTDTLSFKSNFFTNYIDIPLNLAYKLPLGKKAKFLISAGPYLSFFYNGKRNTETLVAPNDTSLKFSKEESNLETGNAPAKLKTLDYGVNARVGFELGNFILSGFMSQGLGNFYQADYSGTFKHRVIGASIGFWLTKAPQPAVAPKPKDQDKDGIPDAKDGCPTEPGTALTNGCPDRDGDGIPDQKDACPDMPGQAAYKGCPIPDTDKDGINDVEDKCPTEAGPVSNGGCPLPKPEPDTDGDGVIDKEDKCPGEAGTAANNGCPVIKKEVIEKINYAARNIFFAKGSDKLATTSYAALDEVVTILNNNPTLRLMIDGYTDNTGKAITNLELSQRRTDAVKKYLTDKGIPTRRLSALGHGADNPVADNSTEAGRTQNRRVELKLEKQ